jgi:DNA repair protein RecN (Recombination protein N)
MITALSIQNLALIEQTSISLEPGFTAIAGETGSGKSLFVDALLLALGRRADSGLVRHGSDRARIEATIDLGRHPEALKICQDIAIPGPIIQVTREISADGRSTVKINQKAVSVSLLKSIGESMSTLQGQHESQTLLDPNSPRDLLDQAIGEPAQHLKGQIQSKLAELTALKTQLSTLNRSERDREQRLDVLQFQISEIQEANPIPGESETLNLLLSRLTHAQKLGEMADSLLENLVEIDASAQACLSATAKSLSAARNLDPQIQPALDLAIDADATIRELARELRFYRDSIDPEPELLESTAARLELLAKLRRKYGETEEQILDHLAKAEGELATLINQEQNTCLLQTQIESNQSELQTLADALSFLRKKHEPQFIKAIQNHLAELDLDQARLSTVFEKSTVTDSGQDSISLFLAANPGEPAQPLNRVASGGELSRIMLAIQLASIHTQTARTIIFDEVDTGLSGRAASRVARKLQLLAECHQVIVISHLPQIAAAADHQIEVTKQITNRQTRTHIKPLDQTNRPAALARLLSIESVSATALANAADLLTQSARPSTRISATG